MVKVSAFTSLIPEQDFITKVPTKTYANYSKAEIEIEIKNNPYSFLNIINNNQKNRYNEIRKKIKYFKEKNILKTSIKKSLYLYQKIELQNSYVGLVCGVSLDDYGNKKIKIHENTIINREVLFAKYLKETKIYAEPVLLAHNGNLNEITGQYITKRPTYDFVTSDQIQHRIWEIDDRIEINKITSFFNKIDNLYIADGHHRMASSYRNNPNQNCLAYIVGKNQLTTHAFHRKISNIKNADLIMMQLRKKFHISLIKKASTKCNKLQFYRNRQWHELDFQDKKDELLVHQLTKYILKPIFGIKNERINTNVTFIPGNNHIQKELLTIKHNEIFFFMNQIDINEIIQISHNNKTTPPKSTFILPKLPSGLIMMELI
tara:strand:- start:333 stop:1457 length:1125 start_codon:yes stop_codon:yes gene_type:complete